MAGRKAQNGEVPCTAEKACKSEKLNRLLFRAFLTMFSLVALLCLNTMRLLNTSAEYAGVPGTAAETTSTEGRRELQEAHSLLQTQNENLAKELEEAMRRMEELSRQNNELAEDNIALQNTLKLAAEAGIKPQNYTRFEGLQSRGGIDRGSYIGQFLGTAYTPSKEECGNDMGITNSGMPVIPGITVAVDKEYWPFGTVFYIKGLGYAVAMDTGSGIKGKYRFDFSVFDRDFAKSLGARKWDVYLVREGKGFVENVDF